MKLLLVSASEEPDYPGSDLPMNMPGAPLTFEW
jgi:hypothetical protein